MYKRLLHRQNWPSLNIDILHAGAMVCLCSLRSCCVLLILVVSSNDSSVLCCLQHYLRGLQNRLQDTDFPVLAPPA